MRPILWGTIWLVIGGVFWIIFSIMFGILKGLGVETGSLGKFLCGTFGLIFFLSIPIAIIFEITRWLKNRK